MEGNTKQAHPCKDNNQASPGSHSEKNTPDKQTTYWGVICRTCRELVAFDNCPYISFGPGAAGMKPGAIRCGRGHNHIYFPRDFGSSTSRSWCPMRLCRKTGKRTEPSIRAHRSRGSVPQPKTPNRR